ncbi:unnamed protein product [Nesidiocoris tenuis]|uniref:Uncharacterized protein n=1 Tax=Nesidiocoris tenuis TaxID=355587 RepID=A0A6H5HAL4_9HEMI|nr:unnamed protein product [Nesidiocoris tenuis]
MASHPPSPVETTTPTRPTSSGPTGRWCFELGSAHLWPGGLGGPPVVLYWGEIISPLKPNSVGPGLGKVALALPLYRHLGRGGGTRCPLVVMGPLETTNLPLATYSRPPLPI